MHLFRSFILVLFVALGISGPSQAEQAPLTLIQQASDQILSELRSKPEQERTPVFVRGLIEKVLLPLMAERTIAERVLADQWQQATPEQQQHFTKEFSRYMVNFYTEVFRAYSGEKVSYQLDEDSLTSSCCTIISDIYQQNGKAIEARYRLERHSEEWKVTDVIVDGVSMVQSNRQQYHYLVSRNGLDKVIDMLRARNNQLRR